MNVFQRLAHRLFGWDYINYESSMHSWRFRVRTTPNGERYILFCSTLGFGGEIWIIAPDGTFKNTTGKWRPLTWRMSA